MNAITDKLNKLLKTTVSDPTKDAPGTISHENGGAIIQSARNTLAQCATGQELIDFADQHGVRIIVVKSQHSFAAQPDPKIVYLSAPAGTTEATPEMVLQLVAALREAFQDTHPDWKRPTFAATQDKFVKTMLEKREDSLFLQCVVAYEIAENTGEKDFLDAFDNMGYSHIMEAYKEDLQEQRGNAKQ